MAKATRITKSELNELQLDIRHVNDCQMKIGSLEVQKTDLLANIIGSQKRLKDIQDKLRKKYGDVVINVHDGTLKPKEADGEVDKKD